jgi:hypothetical protein
MVISSGRRQHDLLRQLELVPRNRIGPETNACRRAPLKGRQPARSGSGPRRRVMMGGDHGALDLAVLVLERASLVAAGNARPTDRPH